LGKAWGGFLVESSIDTSDTVLVGEFVDGIDDDSAAYVLLPATIIYVYAGSALPSLGELQQRGGRTLITPQILIALAGLALLPLLTVAAKKWLLRADMSAS
jgi:hypothetical protein